MNHGAIFDALAVNEFTKVSINVSTLRNFHAEITNVH